MENIENGQSAAEQIYQYDIIQKHANTGDYIKKRNVKGFAYR